MEIQDKFLIFNDLPTSEMTFVKGGNFLMGSDEYADEKPVHEVAVSDYWIGTFPVTQALWKKVMLGVNPSYFKGDMHPVECVSWNDITDKFLPALNKMTGKNYRLPTEAEWEYAARGGTHWQDDFKYAGSHDIDKVAWYDPNSHQKTNPVGLKTPNQLGLFDMSGNVWEWCSDWYKAYSRAAVSNPKEATEESFRVLRGGSWHDASGACRPSHRNYTHPELNYDLLGFRLVINANNGLKRVEDPTYR